MTKAATSPCCNTSEQLSVRILLDGIISLTYENKTKIRKAPMTIAPSTTLERISLFVLRGALEDLPSSPVVPRTGTVIDTIVVVVVAIAVTRSQVNTMTAQTTPQLGQLLSND